MKKLYLLIVVVSLFSVAGAQTSGTFTDQRDGNEYKWVAIGEQIWMAENLAWKPEDGLYWSYRNRDAYFEKYGYLYDWNTAQTACPAGWRLPSYEDFGELLSFVGSRPASRLKASDGWQMNGNGTDQFGFAALPGGKFSPSDGFDDGDLLGFWWTSTPYSGMNFPAARHLYMSPTLGFAELNPAPKRMGFSVRCIKTK